MDATPVNWETLDSLVIDFAKSENLIEDSQRQSSPKTPSPSPLLSPSSSSYQSRLLIRQVRRSLETGDVDAALDLLHVHAPPVLEDHRLLFGLQKQKFIELLREGSQENRDSAINCLRTSLAPCALDAYPEAYEEFKHILLAFIYDKDDQNSPVANVWSERRRFDMAGILSSVLRAHLRAYDPIFSMTLRYLISIHKGFCFRQGAPSPISDLTERLLLEERDPPAMPPESLYEAPPFDEVDIQALAHAVEITRQGAVDSLRFAKGDLFLAFQNELCRMRLDVSLLDELVHEYCVYRGIVDSDLASPSDVNQSETRCCLLHKSTLEAESGNNKFAHSETCSNTSNLEVSSETDADMVSMQNNDVEERYPCDTDVHEDCSTCGTNQPETLKVLQRARTHGTGERSKRKRWRGRDENLEFIYEKNTSKSSRQGPVPDNMLTDQQVSEKRSTQNVIINKVDKYETVLGMKELAIKGMAAEVVEEINAIDPDFFLQNPLLLFQLKQVEFLKLVKCGDYSSALNVASSNLGPLAARNPALLKPLKETILALLKPNEEAFAESLPLCDLASSLQVAIGSRLGIEEPQLMKIMRSTLHTHNEWFKLQMCKDRFESLLRVDSLKEVAAPFLAVAPLKSNADSCSDGSSEVTTVSSCKLHEDGSSPTQSSSRDLICDENAILKVMEFLALPRADAIQLLVQYNGNAETVIQQIFA